MHQTCQAEWSAESLLNLCRQRGIPRGFAPRALRFFPQTVEVCASNSSKTDGGQWVYTPACPETCARFRLFSWWARPGRIGNHILTKREKKNGSQDGKSRSRWNHRAGAGRAHRSRGRNRYPCRKIEESSGRGQEEYRPRSEELRHD